MRNLNFQYDLDEENREDESRVGIPSLQDLLARVRPPTSTGDNFFLLLILLYVFPAAPESDTLSAESFAFILVYSFVFVALVIFIGLRLARRRCRQIF